MKKHEVVIKLPARKWSAAELASWSEQSQREAIRDAIADHPELKPSDVVALFEPEDAA